MTDYGAIPYEVRYLAETPYLRGSVCDYKDRQAHFDLVQFRT